MAVITNIRPTTELEAVNVMLASIGEAPLPPGTDLSLASASDIELAIDILRATSREVQSTGWRFNSLQGLQVAPVGTVAWQDTAGVTTTLNVFKRPTDALSWSPTACIENAGLDLVERPGLQYQEGGVAVPILFDRGLNRDGAEQDRHPFLYLDTVSGFDFEVLPETARRYIAVRAARVFSQSAVGSTELRGFAATDEQLAYRLLQREQGRIEAHNIFQDSADTFSFYGGRRLNYGGRARRVYPGGI